MSLYSVESYLKGLSNRFWSTSSMFVLYLPGMFALKGSACHKRMFLKSIGK